jgi:hypothetical protein
MTFIDSLHDIVLRENNNKPVCLNTWATLKSKLEKNPEACAGVYAVLTANRQMLGKHSKDIAIVCDAIESLPSHLADASVLKSAARKWLADGGISKSSQTKILGAAEFGAQLVRQKFDGLSWYKSLPVSSQYVLSTMTDQDFNQVWTKHTEWGTKPITKHQLEAIKSGEKVSAGKLQPSNSFPRETAPQSKSESFPRETGVSTWQPSHTPNQILDDGFGDVAFTESEEAATSVVDVTASQVPHTQADIIQQFVALAESIDMDNLYASNDLVVMLQPIQERLGVMAEMRVSQPAFSHARFRR